MINKYGKIVDKDNLKWEWIPYGVEFSNSGFVKSKDESENLIDKYENYCLENEGKFIVDEIDYKPNQL